MDGVCNAGSNQRQVLHPPQDVCLQQGEHGMGGEGGAEPCLSAYAAGLRCRRSPAKTAGIGQRRQLQITVLYWHYNVDKCLNTLLELDLILCYGNGNFQLARSISCPVNLQKPPTFAPFDIPLEFYLDDDQFQPTMDAQSRHLS